ncbi:non-homologous end-joining DNA ligase [Dactylosporangium sp. NPDC049525]|uniref:non-homologous end-joining DNA ligase n=1 Tax=Dactylosporangium sp. NPDC049525 TaxID=3154730 RepID=UPI00344469D2
MPDKIRVDVEGRHLDLTNLDKVLYPQVGFTKGEVIDYYTRISPVLLPHLDGRPLTRVRYPNGVDGNSFFEKNAPAGTPDWVRTVRLPVPGSSRGRETIDFIVVEELATLVWLANLAALELHTPQWKVAADGSALNPDLLVIDLDPGPPAGLPECYEVALLVRDQLAVDGLDALPKTSGRKGMQLVAELPGDETADEISAYVKDVAEELARRRPDLIVARMARQLRPGKVFIDWSQNNAFKTTVAPYSLRAGALPTVSAPLTWEEVGEGTLTVADLTPAVVLSRVFDA